MLQYHGRTRIACYVFGSAGTTCVGGHNGKAYPISIPLIEGEEEDVKQRLKEIGEHLLLVQSGVTYKNGHKEVDRLSSVINQMWLDLCRLSG